MTERLIEELQKEAKGKGFLLRLLDRNKTGFYNQSGDRFDLWLEGHLFDSKVATANTLEELYTANVHKIRELMQIRKPGRFDD